MSESRRRGLMMGNVGKGIPISVLEPGTIVQVRENGVLIDFVYLGLNTEQKALILRAACYPSKQRYGTSAIYAGSELDNRLQNTYLPQYAKLQQYLSPATINYVTYDSNYAQIVNTIARSIYVPSYYEMTGEGPESGFNMLPALKTWKNNTNANTARTVSPAAAYWTRSMFSSSAYQNRVNTVLASGECRRTYSFSPFGTTSIATRPVISLVPSTPVNANMITGEM